MQQIQAKVQHAQKICPNNTSIIEIWKQFITMEIVNLTVHRYTNLKINAFLDTLDQEKIHTMIPQLKHFWGFFHARSLLQHLERCLECSTSNAHRTIHQMTFLPKMKCCIQVEEVLGSRHTIKTSRPNTGSIYQA